MQYVRKGELIEALLKTLSEKHDQAAKEVAVLHGWAEERDIREAGEEITRIDAARIIHMFLIKEAKIPDLPDINAASVLRDLYDCRVCVNHIAQVYLRRLIEAREIAGISDKPFLIFDGKERLTKTESEYLCWSIRCIMEEKKKRRQRDAEKN